MKFITRTLALATVSLIPVSAFAASIFGGFTGSGGTIGFSWGNGGGIASCGSTICGVASTILYLINSVAVPLLFAVSFIVFLYGIADKYIFNAEKVSKESHSFILWGLVGFAVMISIWGLVNVVANTFGLGGAYAPPLPQSPIQ